MSASDRAFFGHPRGLATLFFTEMWERFSYYGMRALLILFMTASVATGGLGFSVAKAGAIYGLYTAAVYLAGLPGGWIADRILGLRRAVFVGGIFIALGHYSMAVPRIDTFYTGLLLIVLGTGLLKPNISAIVGDLYGTDDGRRDAGFSIFYMGINIGAFLAPLACGYLGQRVDWHLGFGLAGFGMTCGVVQYRLGARNLGEAGLSLPDAAARAIARRQLLRGATAVVAGAFIVAIFVVGGVIQITAQLVSQAFGILLLGIVTALFVWLLFFGSWTSAERRRLAAILVFFVSSALFWSVFEQAGSTLNLFAERSTDKTVLGYSFPASWLQSLNSLFIIIFAPVFAWLWVKLGRGNPSSPVKFALGLLFAGLGFAVMIGAAVQTTSGAQVSPVWLAATYFLHTVGELCLSPVGLSAMTQLAPHRIVGLVMGIWFLSTALGNYAGGQMASLYESLPLPVLFGWVATVAIAAAVLLVLFVRPVQKLMVAPVSHVQS